MRILYLEICYEGSHLSLKNKSQTYTVEGVNSDFRHYIHALRRRFKYLLGLWRPSYLYLKFSFLPLTDLLLLNFLSLISNPLFLFLLLFNSSFWALSESLCGSSATTPIVDFRHRLSACPSY